MNPKERESSAFLKVFALSLSRPVAFGYAGFVDEPLIRVFTKFNGKNMYGFILLINGKKKTIFSKTVSPGFRFECYGFLNIISKMRFGF